MFILFTENLNTLLKKSYLDAEDAIYTYLKTNINQDVEMVKEHVLKLSTISPIILEDPKIKHIISSSNSDYILTLSFNIYFQGDNRLFSYYANSEGEYIKNPIKAWFKEQDCLSLEEIVNLGNCDTKRELENKALHTSKELIKQLDAKLETIKLLLGSVNRSINKFNEGLPDFIDRKLVNYKEKMEYINEFNSMELGQQKS